MRCWDWQKQSPGGIQYNLLTMFLTTRKKNYKIQGEFSYLELCLFSTISHFRRSFSSKLKSNSQVSEGRGKLWNQWSQAEMWENNKL